MKFKEGKWFDERGVPFEDLNIQGAIGTLEAFAGRRFEEESGAVSVPVLFENFSDAETSEKIRLYRAIRSVWGEEAGCAQLQVFGLLREAKNMGICLPRKVAAGMCRVLGHGCAPDNDWEYQPLSLEGIFAAQELAVERYEANNPGRIYYSDPWVAQWAAKYREPRLVKFMSGDVGNKYLHHTTGSGRMEFVLSENELLIGLFSPAFGGGKDPMVLIRVSSDEDWEWEDEFFVQAMTGRCEWDWYGNLSHLPYAPSTNVGVIVAEGATAVLADKPDRAEHLWTLSSVFPQGTFCGALSPQIWAILQKIA